MADKWLEKRVGPYSERLFTYSELTELYRGFHSPAEIRMYWDTEMWPVDANRFKDAVSAEAAGIASQTRTRTSSEKMVRFQEDAASMAASPASTCGGVSTNTDPQTKLKSARATFCTDPALLGDKFTPTYEQAPFSNFASVNPGDQELGLGGADIDFAKHLRNFGLQKTTRYKPYHTKFLSVAGVDQLVQATDPVLALNPNLQAGFVRKPFGGGRVGVVFVDVFKPEFRVHGHPKNVAMIYTVKPTRNEFRSSCEFLEQVTATAANISRVCVEYNVLADKMGLPRIEVLRVPLFSRDKTFGLKLTVARAIILGLLSEHGEDSPELNFQFEGGAFRSAWHALEAECN